MDYLDYRELCHSGIKGMKWGIRRYQNPDGTLTPEGKQRYGSAENLERYYKKKSNRAAVRGSVLTSAAGALYGYGHGMKRGDDRESTSKKVHAMNVASGVLTGAALTQNILSGVRSGQRYKAAGMTGGKAAAKGLGKTAISSLFSAGTGIGSMYLGNYGNHQKRMYDHTKNFIDETEAFRVVGGKRGHKWEKANYMENMGALNKTKKSGQLGEKLAARKYVNEYFKANPRMNEAKLDRKVTRAGKYLNKHMDMFGNPLVEQDFKNALYEVRRNKKK